MIKLKITISYTDSEHAALAVQTYRRDRSSIKAMIDNALNLRAKLIFDSKAFQPVPLETTIDEISVEGRSIIIVVGTNQETLVLGYEDALNGTTLFVFDGVSSILKNAFQRDEFLLGDYIVFVHISATNTTNVISPVDQLGRTIEPITKPITGITEPITDFFEDTKTVLIVASISAAVIVLSLVVYTIFSKLKT